MAVAVAIRIAIALAIAIATALTIATLTATAITSTVLNTRRKQQHTKVTNSSTRSRIADYQPSLRRRGSILEGGKARKLYLD